MDDYLISLLNVARKMERVRITKAGIVSTFPLYLFGVHLAANSSGATTNTLYHGTGTFGAVDLNLNTLQSTSFSYSWLPPLFYENGLYLDVGSNLESAMFHFIRADR